MNQVLTNAVRQMMASVNPVRRLRKKFSLQAIQLAENAKLSEQTIWKLETGATTPRVETLYKIAGALGVPCWVLTPSAPDWRLGVGDSRHSIRYGDHLKLYRQKMGEDWGPVIEEVAGDLVDWIRTRKAVAA